MKKKIMIVFLALLLCMSFCACGMARDNDIRPGNGMEILPDVSPMPSMDVSDGHVQDSDGIIGNGEGGAGATASPMPSVSPMPTTAPSTSPNP